MSTTAEPRPDGRRARGEERRRVLVDATLEVLAERGVAGLTHRAVAERAGVPLASASYHFAGIDDLMVTALLRATDELREVLAASDARGPRGLAEMLVSGLTDSRGLMLAEYELYLVAARRPRLRDAAIGWLDLLADAFVPDAGDAERSAFMATVDGLCLHALLDNGPVHVERFEAALRAAWPGR